MLTFIIGILFFTIGKPFGQINDIVSIFQVLFMIPLAILFVQIQPVYPLALRLITAAIGVSGMLVSAFSQSLLVLGRIDFQESTRFFPAGGAIGIWLILVGFILNSTEAFPNLMVWIGIFAGIGYLLTVIGFWHKEQESIVFVIGAMILGVSYPIWAIWLGKFLNTVMKTFSAG
jgi:hypothetical protein